MCYYDIKCVINILDIFLCILFECYMIVLFFGKKKKVKVRESLIKWNDIVYREKSLVIMILYIKKMFLVLLVKNLLWMLKFI